jgi:hypothetical protein
LSALLPDPVDPADVAARVAAVRSRIARAAAAAGREPAAVLLVAVSKTHPPQAVAAAAEAGVTDVGENRTEELVAKRAALEGVAPGIRWHMIGRLQRRAAGDVVGSDVLVHGVDSRRLVDRLELLAARDDVHQRILVQVNVGDDPAKGGCSLTGVDELVTYARAQPHLVVEGLMTVPPQPPPGTPSGTAARPHFATLREVGERLDLAQLSMGMSGDLEAAVAEGATIVRVGTDIFGPRGDGPWEPLP